MHALSLFAEKEGTSFSLNVVEKAEEEFAGKIVSPNLFSLECQIFSAKSYNSPLKICFPSS